MQGFGGPNSFKREATRVIVWNWRQVRRALSRELNDLRVGVQRKEGMERKVWMARDGRRARA